MRRLLPYLLILAYALGSMPARAVGLLSLDVHDARVADVLTLLAAQAGVNVVADSSLKDERITVHLHRVTFQQALGVLVRSQGLAVRDRSGILIVGTARALDRRSDASAGALGTRTAVFRLKHARPRQVAKELVPALAEGTVILADHRTGAVVVSGDGPTLRRARTLIAALDARRRRPRATQVVRLRYLRADEAVKEIRGVVGSAVLSVDEGQNAVLIGGDTQARGAVATLVRKIDVAGPQVLFEVKVVDIEPINASSDVGLEFGGLSLSGAPIAGAATYAFTGKALALNVRLNALVTSGQAHILATPKLVTLNNHEADLLIGQTFPVTYDGTAFVGAQVRFLDVGVKLRLTPTIGSDGSVTADLHPEYSEIEGLSSNGYPIIGNRKIDSTLRVRDDETIVLGGLLRDVSAQTISKIPGLGDIPILGAFFRNKMMRRERDEVVFFITPHILKAGASAESR
ncbi:MAG: secretin N-terminal domain-containing protein [Vulcanimicrobiaceae bacterium]